LLLTLAQAPDDELVLVMHDISDLRGTAGMLSHELPTPAAGSAEDLEHALEELEKLRERAMSASKELLDAVRTHMQPPFDPEAGELGLIVEGTALLVRATRAQQDWVRDFLSLQRRKNGLLHLQSTMLRVPAGTAAELGIEGSAEIFASKASFDPLRQRIEAMQGAEIVSAPMVATRTRQRAVVAVLQQVAYVKDVHLVVVEPGGVEIVDPEIDVVQEGIQLELRGLALPGERFALEVDLENTTLERPIPTRTIEVGAERHPVTISTPEVIRVTLDACLTLAHDAVAVFVAPVPSGEGDVLITVHLEYHDFEVENETQGDPGGGK